MKGKFDFNKIKCNTIEFINTNKLFLIYLFFALLNGLLLRIFTIGGHIYLKAIVSDAIVALILGSFAYLMKPKSRYGYFLVWLVIFSALSIANTIYYEFYHSFLSVSLLATSSMIGEVDDSLFSKFRAGQFLYLLIPIVYIIIHQYLKKLHSEEAEIINSKTIFKKIYATILVLVIAVGLTFTSGDASKFVKQWNRPYLVKKYGLYIYHFNDMIQSIYPRLNTLKGYDEDASKYRMYYSCKWENKKEINEYTNIYKGKNLLFIHGESIQNFLINLKINGQEVTPNLNKLASEGMYFNKFYPQISIGTSSDTEFTLLTGLMPSSSGTVFVNYYDRLYYGMPYYFNKMGYYTFSTHANDANYWNRKVMHNVLGYQRFLAQDTYDVPDDSDSPDIVGLGLSDKAFFKQFATKLHEIKDNNTNYMGTIITLSNHSPFNDIEKYGGFDLSIDYEYTMEDGSVVSGSNDYLNDTSMGDYLKSVHYADEALGELFNRLKDENLLENTIIVFYGDHEAKLGENAFNMLYNYDLVNNKILDKTDENYISFENYNYDLIKNTPLIIWDPYEEYNKVISSTMGMYDVLPTIANMFGFEEKYSLGHDIFDSSENIVVFPNGNVLTDKVYYSAVNEDYISISDEPINNEYIEEISFYATKIIDVSDGIITHDLISIEGENVGKCDE